MSKTLQKHLIEIRFKPNSRFLDRRGEISDILSNATEFDQWNIGNNKIEFKKKEDSTIGAFLSFRNIGLFTEHPQTDQAFKSSVKDFLRSAWDFFPHEKITRIGIRSTYLVETKDFKKAFNQYRKKFLALSDEDLNKFDGNLIDLGFPLNFIDGENYFNITTGPMEDDQSKQFVSTDEDDLPHTGIYVDIDYFKTEVSPHVIQKHVLEFLDKGVEKGQNAKKLIVSWVSE